MPTEIRPGVYDVTTRRDPNGRRYRTFLFDDPVPTLVDTGHEGTTDALFEALDELGVDPERVLITHGDGDHVGGVDAVVDRYDAELCVPEGVDVGGDTAPDRRLTDGETVSAFTAVHVPGHTAAHHAYIHDDVAVLGDAVFGSDLRGLEPGGFTLPPGVYSEDLNLADASLESLLAHEFDVGLVYHGSSVTERADETLARFVDFPGRP
jgi:glyoxylase-like metal-dependent hydrolase (beta-lactamase superfamily II)